MDLENALSKIIELEGELSKLSDTNESLKIQNETLLADINKSNQQIADLKRMNMTYFERLTMETKTQPNQTNPPIDSKTEEPQSWESFMNDWK